MSTTTATPPPANITTLIDAVTTRLAAVPDYRAATSEQARTVILTETNTLRRLLSWLNDAPATLERAETRLAEATAVRDNWLAKQTEITEALAAAPDVSTITSKLERRGEENRQAYLRRQLELLREGSLLVGPGQTYGSLAPLETQVEDFTKRRDDARARLDGVVKEAEAVVREANAA